MYMTAKFLGPMVLHAEVWVYTVPLFNIKAYIPGLADKFGCFLKGSRVLNGTTKYQIEYSSETTV